MPACLRASGLVRASRKIQFASRARDVHTFWPSITHWSPSSTARVDSEARSDPEPGSEKPWHQRSSPLRIRGRNAPLLRLGPPPQQRAAEHLDAERVVVAHRRHAGPGQLLDEHDLLEPAQPGAAVLLRPRHPEQPVGGQRRPPLLDEPVGFVAIGDGAEALPVRGQVLVEELADPLAEQLGVRRVPRVQPTADGHRANSASALSRMIRRCGDLVERIEELGEVGRLGEALGVGEVGAHHDRVDVAEVLDDPGDVVLGVRRDADVAAEDLEGAR